MLRIDFQSLFVFHHIHMVNATLVECLRLFLRNYFTIKNQQWLWSIRLAKDQLRGILRHLLILTEDENAFFVFVVPLRIAC